MVGVTKIPTMLWVLGVVFTFGAAAVGLAEANNVHNFIIKEANYPRLCQNKNILTVNGEFPGPTITARRGDKVIVNVINQGKKNITIHWHGVDQPRNPWFDGPEFITQCPIQPGTTFSYEILLSEEEGTIWWHAHSDFDRASVHGAFVIHPKNGTYYPYKMPHKEIPIILGEWWKADVTHLLEESKRTGGEVNLSDANIINGQPGDFFPCSKDNTFKLPVQTGKTYLLRIINAGLTNDLFCAIAGHLLTIVGTDGRYMKPFTVKHIMISPGQTFDALLEADRAINGSSNGRYYMASRTFSSNPDLSFNNSTATAILEYEDAPAAMRAGPPDFPNIPNFTDMKAATEYTAQFRSLASRDHPVDVPMKVDVPMYITIAVNTLPCARNETCEGEGNTRLAASLNNVSFQNPPIDILDAYYKSQKGVYEVNFPDQPPFFFNFTDTVIPKELEVTKAGTKVKMLNYGEVVEVVFQDTSINGAETHPMHLHGFAFYVVGRGFGNYDKNKDPATYNLIDPPYQNTVTVPKAGWTAIRWRASNPGVWFMHCHFDRHTVWGMNTVFIVRDGKKDNEKMFSRPPTMPGC